MKTLTKINLGEEFTVAEIEKMFPESEDYTYTDNMYEYDLGMLDLRIHSPDGDTIYTFERIGDKAENPVFLREIGISEIVKTKSGDNRILTRYKLL